MREGDAQVEDLIMMVVLGFLFSVTRRSRSDSCYSLSDVTLVSDETYFEDLTDDTLAIEDVMKVIK